MQTRGRKAVALTDSHNDVLSPLPSWFVHAVFLLLPADQRLRCVEVSRAWRALLTDTSLWTRLDLSITSVERLNLPLLRAAVAKAGGKLRELDFTGQECIARAERGRASRLVRAVRDAIAANAATLVELRLETSHWFSPATLRQLLEGSPRLQRLEASMLVVNDDHRLTRSMLCAEPPYQALRLRRLFMARFSKSALDVINFWLDMRRHTSLEELVLYEAALDTAAVAGAVVDACSALRLRALFLFECRLGPRELSVLTRLIVAGSLRMLVLVNNGVTLFDEADESTRLFVAAVRASAMVSLQLIDVGPVPAAVAEAENFINTRRRENPAPAS